MDTMAYRRHFLSRYSRLLVDPENGIPYELVRNTMPRPACFCLRWMLIPISDRQIGNFGSYVSSRGMLEANKFLNKEKEKRGREKTRTN
eukprot:scaffold226499_cov24-Attheya_sp.AAC.1